jgi:hypothetical protein
VRADDKCSGVEKVKRQEEGWEIEMAANQDKLEMLLLKAIVYQMFVSGRTQDEIARYLSKSKGEINAMLKPLSKKSGSK